MASDTKIIIPVTRIELLDLEETLHGAVERRDEALDPDQQGEFFTAAACVALTALAIKALSVWLAKNRGRDDRIEESIKVELPNGTVVTRTLAVTSTSKSELPESAASALEEIARTTVGA